MGACKQVAACAPSRTRLPFDGLQRDGFLLGKLARLKSPSIGPALTRDVVGRFRSSTSCIERAMKATSRFAVTQAPGSSPWALIAPHLDLEDSVFMFIVGHA